ncbi:GntR family transcriptional repressor for pyruvate dehydrogenase complex [Salirhabdus euzebyi]|uniref:GntR family transcriptional repressor for pyruvate dehydrogenase complex n=1 Tax=Salirhabdus euzebyi TaxID=394506 RepID=A0A841Q5N7_9BACI|nr:FadR/GntR family transcriptional regulator [Salirhabdus euzebyi]MBB6453673.1 GntR family transcriptional repressor for pyruvate dehydrogenase complex [Salirhabdus euzebyi]
MYEGFKLNRKGISSVVGDYIKQLIHENKFKPGEKLPAERQMADLLNVSRNSVRESYKILEAMGYLTIKHGDGVYVSSKDEHLNKIASSFFLGTEDIVDLFAIRKVLEVSGIDWAVNHITESELNELVHIVNTSKELVRENANVEQIANLDQKFHLTLARISKNTFLVRIMISLIDLLEESRIQSMKIVGRVSQSIQEHTEIIEALRLGDKLLVKKAMTHHLESVERSLLTNLSSSESSSTN